jgi:hypothetical protein
VKLESGNVPVLHLVSTAAMVDFVLWVMTCLPRDVYRLFRRNLAGSNIFHLKVDTYQTIRYHITEDRNADISPCYRNPTPANKPPDNSQLLDNIEWLTVKDTGSESMHTRYFNIGQVVLGSPTEFLNQNLGPVKIHMAQDLDKERMEFWDSLPLDGN